MYWNFIIKSLVCQWVLEHFYPYILSAFYCESVGFHWLTVNVCIMTICLMYLVMYGCTECLWYRVCMHTIIYSVSCFLIVFREEMTARILMCKVNLIFFALVLCFSLFVTYNLNLVLQNAVVAICFQKWGVPSLCLPPLPSLLFHSFLSPPRPYSLNPASRSGRALWAYAVSSGGAWPPNVLWYNGTFWAENYAFGDTKSVITHIFVSWLEFCINIVPYANKQTFYGNYCWFG